MSMFRCILASFAALAVSLPAAAQFPSLPSGGETADQNSQRERVSAELVPYEGDLVAGEQGHLGIVLQMQDGWKIQAGVGSGDEMGNYLFTRINLDLPDGWEAGAVHWPEADEFEIGTEAYSETLRGYGGRIVAVVPVTPPAGSAGEYDIEAEIEYQACDDTTCEMQTSTLAKATIFVARDAASATAAEYSAVLAALFEATLARDQAATEPAAEAASTDDADDEEAAAASPRGSSFFGFHVPRLSGPLGLVVLALLSALGGFILNLTPCVLPVIPIKIMTLQQHANKPGKNLVLGLWMFAGVVAFWVAIGLPVAFFTGMTDPSQLFGIWWVTFGIGAIIAIMGIGIMGTFSIQLPQSVYLINPKADTAWGSFVFGIMTAVLGLPCFGFVAGALLVGSAQMAPATIMIIFTSLGIGMALPYLVLSAKPSLVEKIPHTGPASELVKQVIGLALLAAAAFFIGSGLIALVSEYTYLAEQLHWWAAAIFLGVAMLWLVLRTWQITRSAKPRIVFTFLAAITTFVAFWYTTDTTVKARSDYEKKQEAEASPRGYLAGVWNDYTPETFANAREDGNVVVLDFTAEWCVNCKVLKAAVLERDPVASRLNDEGVAKFTVDLTSRSADGWDFLRELGQTGIPLLAIYMPGEDDPWQSNSYTSNQVIAALDAAENGREDVLARQ